MARPGEQMVLLAVVVFANGLLSLSGVLSDKYAVTLKIKKSQWTSNTLIWTIFPSPKCPHVVAFV